MGCTVTFNLLKDYEQPVFAVILHILDKRIGFAFSSDLYLLVTYQFNLSKMQLNFCRILTIFVAVYRSPSTNAINLETTQESKDIMNVKNISQPRCDLNSQSFLKCNLLLFLRGNHGNIYYLSKSAYCRKCVGRKT